jgi:hypothetical protein
LYCVKFKIDSDHEVELVGEPEEVARTTDYEYVGDMETEAKAAVKEGAVEAEEAGHEFHGNQWTAEANRAVGMAKDTGTSHMGSHIEKGFGGDQIVHTYKVNGPVDNEKDSVHDASEKARTRVGERLGRDGMGGGMKNYPGHKDYERSVIEPKQEGKLGVVHRFVSGEHKGLYSKSAKVQAAADFRGNQHKSASDLAAEHTAAANVASREANRASKEADDKVTHQAAAARHTTAQQMHEVAAEKCKACGKDEQAEEHEIKAERHERKANDHKGKMEDDQMDKTGAVETKDAKKKEEAALAAKAEAGHIKLDCASKDTNKLRTVLPTDDGVIMYMPAGVHTITPSQAGRPIEVSVLVNEKSAKVLETQRKTLTANGKKPFFSVMHATEIAAFWPTKFFWDKRIDATGSLVEGVWAEGEWTKSGRESVEGKDFRTFSPTFHVDAVRNDPDNPSIVVDASEYAAANMGALENDPAFQEMSPLWCKDASTKAVKDTLTELKAGGKNPTLKELCSAVYNKHKIILSPSEVADRITASEKGAEVGGDSKSKGFNPVYYAGEIKAKAAAASHAAFMATAHAYMQDKDGADGDHHQAASALHASAQEIHEEGHKAASEAGMDDATKEHHNMHKDMHGLMAKHHSDMHE